ncbi:MAG: hypothetical protein LLH30_18705 [Candidatus Manganitrophus sp. SA1]|nr:hypothetical protein [Candidatus Manganitrophus morganii]
MKTTSKHPNKFIPFSDAIADGKMERLWHEPESILDDRASPTYAGVLRPGIKVPQNDGPHRLSVAEMQTYRRMMKEHLSPREIEKAIGKELRPENVGYFSVYSSECRTDPEHAVRIRKLYGNETGEIQRVRITFPENDWWDIIPHKLMAFRESGLYCSSEPKEGQLIATRDISMDGPPEGGPSRPFRRRLKQFPCVPDECPVYQKNYCKLSGLLHFLIVGVPGTDVWRVPTNSWHSVRGILKKITRFNKALSRRGRELAGIPFWLSKYKASVSIWDPKKGRRRRVDQWLFGIEAPEFPLADLLVKHAGFTVPESMALPMLPSAAAADRGDPKAAAPATRSQNESKEETKTETSAETSAGERPRFDPQPQEIRSQESKPAKPEFFPSLVSDGATPAISEEATITGLREKIQKEVEPKGSVPMEVITLCSERFRKHRLSELTLGELQQLDRSIEDYKRSPWAHCSRCSSLLYPEAKSEASGAIGHDPNTLCRECRKNESSRSTLPPMLTVERKPAGQIQGAGF